MAKQRNGGVILACKILAGILATGVLGLGAWQAQAFLGHEKLDVHPVAGAKLDGLEKATNRNTGELKELCGKVEAGFAAIDGRLDTQTIQQATMNTTQQAILDEVKRLRRDPP